MYGILGTVHCLLFQDDMKVNKDDKGRWKITKCFRRYVPVLFTYLSLLRLGNCPVTSGSLSNDDCDVNENDEKAIGGIVKTTTLHVHHTFLYISLPSLHDYDVKMPNFTFCGGREHKTTTFFFFS